MLEIKIGSNQIFCISDISATQSELLLGCHMLVFVWLIVAWDKNVFYITFCQLVAYALISFKMYRLSIRFRENGSTKEGVRP